MLVGTWQSELLAFAMQRRFENEFVFALFSLSLSLFCLFVRLLVLFA